MYGSVANANFTGAMSVPAIGAAKGFLELFEERIGKKVTQPDTTKGPYVPGGLGATMNHYAAAAAQVDASRALLILNAMDYARVPAKDVSQVENEKLRRDSAYTAQQARRAVNRLFEECGGTGIKEDSPLQQFWRDTNAAAAHHGLTWDWQAEAWVNAALGIAVSPV
jgi:alkylation response protein AidB-like acyl-CoA dehydrogenase